MADRSRAPLYGLAVLFTAFILKDFLWPSEMPTNESNSVHSKEIPSLNMNKFAGPTLKFAYWSVFEQYSAILHEKYPSLMVEGDNYPPPYYRLKFGQILGSLKLLLIVLVVAGINPFEYLGLQTPSVWMWTQDNKFYACLMTFFLCNAIEGQLISTGAFEIVFNDVPLWSKLETGRIPQPPELFQMIDNHLQMSPHLHLSHKEPQLA
nr:EOG090X0DP2 [Sida crystallina]